MHRNFFRNLVAQCPVKITCLGAAYCCAIMGLNLSACLPPKPVSTDGGKKSQLMPGQGGRGNGNANVNGDGSESDHGQSNGQLTIYLPEIRAGQNPAAAAPVTSALIIANPRDMNCQKASKFADQVPYSSTPVSKTLNAECDYFVKVALTGRSNSGRDETYYAMSSAVSVTQSDLSQGPFILRGNLDASAAALSAGLPRTLTLGEQSLQNNTRPSVSPYPTQTYSPSPTQPYNPSPTQTYNPYPTQTFNPNPTQSPGAASLPPQLAEFVLDQGSTQVKLGQFWKSKYLMVDFSQAGCPPCVSHAQDMANEESRFSGISGCQALILLPSGQIDSWFQAIGSSTNFAARISASSNSGHGGFTRLIGAQSISSTPTFIVIDRTGAVLARGSGGEPRQAVQYCP